MQRITFALLAAGGALALGPAQAQPADPMAGYYGNRLKIELASGYWSGVRVFSPDHTFRDAFDAEGQKGTAKGRWTIEDGKICVLADEPGAARFCNLGLGKKVGDKWIDHDPYTGNEVRFTLEPGPK